MSSSHSHIARVPAFQQATHIQGSFADVQGLAYDLIPLQRMSKVSQVCVPERGASTGKGTTILRSRGTLSGSSLVSQVLHTRFLCLTRLTNGLQILVKGHDSVLW